MRRWAAALGTLVVIAVTSTPLAARADDAGVDAGLDAGVDAGVDSGVDAGLDAGRDAGLDAAEAGALDATVADVGAIAADASVPLDATIDAGPAAASPSPGPHGGGGETSSAEVLRTLLGLVALLVLAYVGGHPRVTRLEERLGIAQVVTSGLPYVFLGLLARRIDVLNDATLDQILPLLQFGLGWIGFQTGFGLEARALDRVARGTGTVVILLTGFPFLVIGGASALLLWLVGLGPDPFALARDASLLGLAGALSAPTLERVIGQKMSAQSLELARAVGHLDDVVGVIALACLAAFLHVTEGSLGWHMPGVGWVFVTFGMAVAVGLVVYTVLRGTDSAGEKTSLLLGSVALTAGLSGYLALSPLVICFLAGVLLRNLPGEDKDQLEDAFRRLERPIYLLFLVIVGALWNIGDWRGWALLPVFVIARFAGRWIGARTARSLPEDERPSALDDTDDRDLVSPPMGQLALAFVVTAQTLYASPGVQAIVTAVVGGAVLIEISVQVLSRRARPRPASQPPPPPDDEDDAPSDDAPSDDADRTRADGAKTLVEPPRARADDETTEDE